METMVRWVNAKGQDKENHFDHDEENSLEDLNYLISMLVNNNMPFKSITAKKK